MLSRHLLLLATLACAPLAAADGVDVHLGRDETTERCVQAADWPTTTRCETHDDAAAASVDAMGTRVAEVGLGTTTQSETVTWSWSDSASESETTTRERGMRARVLHQETDVVLARCQGESYHSHYDDETWAWSRETCAWGPEDAPLFTCARESYSGDAPWTTGSYDTRGCSASRGVERDGRAAGVHAAHGESVTCPFAPEPQPCEEAEGAYVGAWVATSPSQRHGQDVWVPEEAFL